MMETTTETTQLLHDSTIMDNLETNFELPRRVKRVGYGATCYLSLYSSFDVDDNIEGMQNSG